MTEPYQVTYHSETYWSTEGYLITVIIGGFSTPNKAAMFGTYRNARITKGTALDHLIFINKTGEEHKLYFDSIVAGRSNNIMASKLRPESMGKEKLSGADFTNIDIRSEISTLLNAVDQKFEFITHGVRDSDGNLIDISNLAL